MTDDYSFSAHDPRQDSDDTIAERVAYSNVLQAEILPDEPPTPVELAIASTRSMPKRYRILSVRARSADGKLVGAASAAVDPDVKENLDLMFLNLSVLPDHRRRGLGSQLLAHLLGFAAAEGRTRLLGRTNERVPAGGEFARALGAEPKQAGHVNHLMLDGVDRQLLDRWAAEGPMRAQGYELVGFDNRVPDDMLDDFVDLVHVMNTMPRDDLEVEDEQVTPAQIREREERHAAVGGEDWTLVARHVESGALAGFTDLGWNPSNPSVMWVGATGVKPEHRGKALGKWLKAVMTIRVLDERPEVTEIRTGNADSNDAMLGINRQMGYKPLIADTTWEVGLAELQKRLSGRGLALEELASPLS